MDNVDELLESFVLDSADLCIMSSGGQPRPAPDFGSDVGNRQLNELSSPSRLAAAAKETCKTRDQFDYLCQLAAHSLARSFRLLQQSSEPAACDQTNLAKSTKSRIGGDKVIKENYYSIEISATLFLNERVRSKRREAALIGGIQSDEGDTAEEERPPPTQAAESPTPTGFSIVDLLLDAPKGEFSCSASSLSVSTSDSGELASSTDNELSGVFGACGQPSAAKASPNLSALDCPNLETALAALEVIKSKLRCLERDKAGFARSNKLLLVSLKLKRGFNGGLFDNRMCLIDFDQSFVELHPIFESIFNGQALAHLRRHRFHLSALKQSLLSCLKSAQTNDQNTGTLKKQHHQVASHEKLIQAEWLLYKQLSSALIRTLLIVHVRKPAGPTSARLQEARGALDHERRMMRENLVLLEFARSIQRASATRLRRRKRHLKSHLVSSNVSMASNLSASLACREELVGSSLFRLGQAPLDPADCCLSAKHRGLLVGDRKMSLDTTLATARRHHHHHRHRRLDEAACQLDRAKPAAQHRNQLSMQPRLRAGRKHSDFTESSSLSTSSGSQTQRVRSTKSSRAASNGRQPNRFEESNLSGSNNFSDSDSVTSANLNSCSSSSFNRLISAPQGLAQRSRHRRDIELKWMTKQSSRASQHSTCQRRALIEQIELAVRRSPTTSRRSSSTSRALASPQRLESSVIQIDCEPVCAATSHQDVREQRFGDRREGYDELMAERRAEGQIDHSAEQLFEGVKLDNVSDVCSLVAEPPKQLRLEEFLSQLNCSMIAPETGVESSQQSSLVGPTQTGDERLGRQVEPLDGRVNSAGALVDACSSALQFSNGLHSDFQNPARLISHNNIGNNSLSVSDSIQVDEDDEDCKSHSSILEHLSSLALESNSKLNSRQQSRQTHQQMDSLAICKQSQQPDREIDLNLNLILQPPSDGSLMLELGQDSSYPPLNTLDGVHRQHNANSNSRLATNEGHLQKLLNNSVQLRRANSRVAVKDPNSIGHRLRALSISCQTGSSAHPSSASPSSGSSGTFISPDGSVCCSTSSSSNDTKLSDRKNEASPTNPTSRSEPKANPHTDLIRRVIT